MGFGTAGGIGDQADGSELCIKNCIYALLASFLGDWTLLLVVSSLLRCAPLFYIYIFYESKDTCIKLKTRNKCHYQEIEINLSLFILVMYTIAYMYWLI